MNNFFRRGQTFSTIYIFFTYFRYYSETIVPNCASLKWGKKMLSLSSQTKDSEFLSILKKSNFASFPGPVNW